MKEKRLCSVEGCENKLHAKGYCRKHYLRFYKYGDPLYIKIENHSRSRTSEYKTWNDMKHRCYNSNCAAYHRYGGRGIKICDRWLKSFVNFLEDVGPKPFPGAQLDRIDNNGNYCKGNCRWVSAKDNGRNRSTTKLTVVKAENIREDYKKGNITQKELGIIYKVSTSVISQIINNKIWI